MGTKGTLSVIAALVLMAAGAYAWFGAPGGLADTTGGQAATGGYAASNLRLTLDPNLRLPYAQDWNLNIQRSFGADWLFQIGYVGTTGVKLPRFIEGDPAVYVPGIDTNPADCAPAASCPISNENNVNQRRLYSGCTLAQPPSDCEYGSVGEIASIANSNYNAGQISVVR